MRELRIAILNVLPRMKAELGDLDRVTLTLKVVGMVNSNPSFTKQASAVDGTSGSFRARLLYKGQACL